MSPRKEPALLTTKEVAEQLGVTTQQVRRYCKDGVLPHERLGRLYAVKPTSLKKFMDQTRPGPGRPRKLKENK